MCGAGVIIFAEKQLPVNAERYCLEDLDGGVVRRRGEKVTPGEKEDKRTRGKVTHGARKRKWKKFPPRARESERKNEGDDGGGEGH